MRKYFEETKIVKLSEHLKSGVSVEMSGVVEYLISCLGDVELPEAIIEGYSKLFSISGGRYSVRTEEETVKGLYEFCQKFPRLSKEAFYKISSRYIKDLFEEYSLETVFEKLISIYGEEDEAVEKFISYIEIKAEEQQERYILEASKLDEYYPQYYMLGISEGYQYIPYLKSLVVREHIPVESIIESMASPELVKKDVERLTEIARKSRCYMGMGLPVSYKMTKAYAKKGELSEYGEKPQYYVSSSEKYEEATFTTEEFIKSTQKGKEQKVLRKK